ncbi:MAG TPA: efflux RND transporter periplasmic adaptor subunit [Leptolinea sp.]
MKLIKFSTLSLLSLLFAITLVSCQAAPKPASPTQSITETPTSSAAPGRLVFEGEAIPVDNVTLSFLSNGVVDQVLVKEGDRVNQGDIIARLKGSEKQKAAVSAAQSELLTAQQALNDLNKNSNVARADAQLKLAQAKKALDKAVENRNYKNYKKADQWYIDQSQASYILALNDFNNAKMVWENWKDKDATDTNRAFALQNFAAARKKVEQAEANYNFLQGAPEEVDIQISEGELVVAKANYEKAQNDWELVKNGANEDDLKLAQERGDNATAQLASAQTGLDDLDLKSTIAGTVVSSNLKTGQVSAVGSSSVVIADLSRFQIETNDLTELNISRVGEGDAVKISFDGIPGLFIPGKVERIKPLGEDNQGDITYTVLISMDQQDPRIKWRMTASIEFTKLE